MGVLSDGKEIDNVLIKNNEIIETEIKRRENYAFFIHQMRFNLDKESSLDKWIDLIFGIHQKYYIPNVKFKYKYYEKSSEINFKNDPMILNDALSMDKVNFGLLPYQLFNEKFPTKNIDDDQYSEDQKMLEELKKLNIELFEDEHIKINSPFLTFVCKGRILIDENYIKIINPNGKTNKRNNATTTNRSSGSSTILLYTLMLFLHLLYSSSKLAIL